MLDLLKIRDEIDIIDRQIVDLFEKRMNLVTQVADYKISTGKAVFDAAREKDKLDAVATLAHSDFASHGARELFKHIMSISRKKQYQLLTEYGCCAPTGFAEIKELDFTHVSAAYIEESATAAREYFPKECGLILCADGAEACEALKRGDVNYLFLPVQDWDRGYVSDIYNLLAEYGFYILEKYSVSYEPKDQYLLISKDKLSLCGADKISICFEAPDTYGSLYHLISHLVYNNLNMNRIESIIISRDPLDYRFFIDISGNLNDSAIKNAILGLQNEGRNFHILGNYR